MRIIFGILIWIIGIIAVFYIAIWWGIVEPIISIADMIDNDTLTAKAVGWEIIKFLTKEILAAIVGYALFFIGGLVAAR